MNWEWIKTTEQLQIDAYGNDLRNASGSDRDQHIRDNVLAATDELHEVLGETSWKPWSTETGVVNKENFKGEIVDVLHFVGNLIILANITEEELWEAYREKQNRNRQRMSKAGGYQASKNKCPNCSRELDRAGAYTALSQRYVEAPIMKSGQAIDVDRYTEWRLQCRHCSNEFLYCVNVGESLPYGDVSVN